MKITEAYKTAIISTAHVTAEDFEQLPIACFDPITDRGLNWAHGTEYDWIVRAGMRDNSWADELRTFNIFEAAIANIKMILDAAYDVVPVDRDAELGKLPDHLLIATVFDNIPAELKALANEWGWIRKLESSSMR
ncbi:hypothetical protein LNO36_29785 [Klebsiella variicola subsp. variicola]|nr:hypothetical protein [Klebsiella variicola subsp. variicola]MDU7296152.1 hypothetical protein [Klebsiella pneumoniae]